MEEEEEERMVISCVVCLFGLDHAAHICLYLSHLSRVVVP